MFGALKPGFRSLATLKLIVNVLIKLNRKEQLRHCAVPCGSTAFLFTGLLTQSFSNWTDCV